MDNLSLDALLTEGRSRQFWLKPIGYPKDHPCWNLEELRTWTESQIEVHFSETPAKVAVGAIVIAYRVNISRLIYVAERLPKTEWIEAEVRPEWARQRWPYYIKARNLSPEYGRVWKQHDLQPFALAKEYNNEHPGAPARLGAILRGKDKAEIPVGFAHSLLRRIRELPVEEATDDRTH